MNIDGTTQPGTNCEPRNLKIELDFTTAYASASNVSALSFKTTANSSTLQGVAMYGEPDNLPQAPGADSSVAFNAPGSTIRCNNFGLTADNKRPSVEFGYTNNIGGLAMGESADDSIVGGTTPADRNVFADGHSGVSNYCDFAGNNIEGLQIFGNYFGTDVTGEVAIPNRQVDMSVVCGENIQIGGSNSGERNVFAGSGSGPTISISSISTGAVELIGTKVQGNSFGLSPSGVAGAGFGVSPSAIILIDLPGAAFGGADSSNHQNLIGGTESGEANTITGFTKGISIGTTYADFGGGPLRSSFPTVNNTVIGNKIYGNDFGVELCDINILAGTNDCDTETGPNPNDPGDPDTGANDYLNKPEITAISQVGNQITFTYDLDVIGSPSDQYRVEFFSNDSADTEGYGQGQNMLGATTATASGPTTSLQATFTLPDDSDITSKVFASTATVVDSSLTYGFGSTSEFGRVVDGVTASYTPASNESNLEQSETSSSNGRDTSQLANTGTNYWLIAGISSLLITVSGSVILHKKSYSYKLGE